MNISLQNQIKKLQGDIDDIIAGYYTAPSALGPNTLSKNSVKARSIRSGNIDVSNLEAVQTKTGNLSVDGNLTIGTGGSLRSGKTSYSDTANAGFWMGIDSSVTKIRVGNIGHTSGWTWDGTSLAITGSISATSGTIGGWTISSTDLSSDTGSIGMASSGSIRFWSGSSTPSSAPFRVSSAGVLTSTSGSIGGWTIDSTGIRLGSGSTARGMDSGSTAFYAGSATPSSAPFNVTTAGALTASSGTIGGITIGASSLSAGGWSINSSGSLTAPSGTIGGGSMSFSSVTISGTLTLGSGGNIVDADGSTWDQTGITLRSSNTFGDAIKWMVSGSNAGSIYASSYDFTFKRSSGSYITVDTSDQVGFWTNAGGLFSLHTLASYSTTARIYPGNQTTRQTTYYLDAGSSGSVITNGIGIGGMLGISSGNTINFIAPGTGGSASNWGSFTVANIPDKSAGYFLIQIAGTNYRVPFYANA